MSGIKNLANAIMNDPSFASKAGMSAAEAAKFVGKGEAGGEDMKKPDSKRSAKEKY